MYYRYFLNLYKQYCNARGLLFSSFDIKNLPYEFVEWVTTNSLLAREYKNYLLHIGFYDSNMVAEVEKGVYDSIADDMEIISPYARTMKLPNSKLLVVNGVPLVERHGDIIVPEQKVLLTHNPYDDMRIINWTNIHNLGDYNISVGMYGSIYDKDFSKKIDIIQEMTKKMTGDYVVNYETDNDNYYCSLNSRRNVKVKSLTK